MNTHAQITAAPMEVPLGGQLYRMSPLNDVDIAELDNWLKARVIRMARESLSPDADEADRRLTVESAIAYATTLTWMSGQGAKLMATLDGMAQIIWQSIKRHHPNVTPAEIRSKLLDPRSMEEAETAFGMLNRVDGQSKKKKKRPRHRSRKPWTGPKSTAP